MARIYTLPQFPLLMDVWDSYLNDPARNLAISGVRVAKYFRLGPDEDFYPYYPFLNNAIVWLRFDPAGPYYVPTDFLGAFPGVFELPSGSFRYYAPVFFEVANEGFTNQYMVARCYQIDADGNSIKYGYGGQDANDAGDRGPHSPP